LKFLIRAILAISVRRPKTLLALCLALAFASLLGVTRIGFDDGLRSVFASDSQVFQDYVDNSESFAHSETDIAVLFTAPDGLNGDSLALLQDFVLEAQFLDGVDAVFSLFSLQHNDPATGNPVALIPSDLQDEAAVQAALAAVSTLPGTGSRVISKDHAQTVVMLSLGQAMADMKGSSSTLRQLTALAGKMTAGTDITIGFTGLLSIRDQIISGLKSDQIRINLIGALLGLIVSFALFRSFWVTVLNTAIPMSALVFCLGAFGWMGLSINALSNALPVLILVLASSDSIHMTYEVRRLTGMGQTVEAAVIRSVKDIAGPCVLTSLTTILAFTSLFISDSPVVRQLAATGAVGVFIAMLTVVFLHPMVFLLAGRFESVRRALPVKAAVLQAPRFGAALFRGPVRRFKFVSALAAALCVVSIATLYPIEAKYRILENIDPSLPVAKVMAKVETITGPITSIDVPVAIASGHSAFDPEAEADLRALHARLQTVAGVQFVISLETLKSCLLLSHGEASCLLLLVN